MTDRRHLIKASEASRPNIVHAERYTHTHRIVSVPSGTKHGHHDQAFFSRSINQPAPEPKKLYYCCFIAFCVFARTYVMSSCSLSCVSFTCDDAGWINRSSSGGGGMAGEFETKGMAEMTKASRGAEAAVLSASEREALPIPPPLPPFANTITTNTDYFFLVFAVTHSLRGQQLLF